MLEVGPRAAEIYIFLGSGRGHVLGIPQRRGALLRVVLPHGDRRRALDERPRVLAADQRLRARRGAQAAPSFFFLGAFRGAIVCFFRPLTGAGAGFFRGAAAGFLGAAGAAAPLSASAAAAAAAASAAGSPGGFRYSANSLACSSFFRPSDDSPRDSNRSRSSSTLKIVTSASVFPDACDWMCFQRSAWAPPAFAVPKHSPHVGHFFLHECILVWHFGQTLKVLFPARWWGFSTYLFLLGTQSSSEGDSSSDDDGRRRPAMSRGSS